MATSIARRSASALALALGVLASMLVALGAPAHAADGKVVGQVLGSRGDMVDVTMLWFDRDWGYLGSRRVPGDIYSISLPPGRYHLQFVDLRPADDVTRYAPSDVTVTVGSGRTVHRDVKMRRGAAITGIARAGGRPAGGARVVATNTHEQSYEVRADGEGRFAVGGLPSGSYSVFTYDRRDAWVGESSWVPGLKRGRTVGIAVDLATRGGSLLVQLRRPDGRPMPGTFPVTAVSRTSGQFWTARARRGEVSFSNLHPGRYRLVAPGVGNYFARTGDIVGARVQAGRADLASSFTWTRRGGWVTGYVLDAADGETPLTGAQVVLYADSGARLAETRAAEDGGFTLDGPLATQEGATVVVDPVPGGGGWMQGANWCQFLGVEIGPVSVVAGQETPLDEPVLLPHEVTTNIQCA